MGGFSPWLPFGFGGSWDLRGHKRWVQGIGRRKPIFHRRRHSAAATLVEASSFAQGSGSFQQTFLKNLGNRWFLKRTMVENNGGINP